jgi:hypothetical protein
MEKFWKFIHKYFIEIIIVEVTAGIVAVIIKALSVKYL